MRKQIKEMFCGLTANEMCQQYCSTERTYGFRSGCLKECKMSKLFSKISIKLGIVLHHRPQFRLRGVSFFALKMIETMAEVTPAYLRPAASAILKVRFRFNHCRAKDSTGGSEDNPGL